MPVVVIGRCNVDPASTCDRSNDTGDKCDLWKTAVWFVEPDIRKE